MNPEHVLIRKATRNPKPDPDPTPSGAYYDPAVGAWRLNETGELLMRTPERPRPQTKKNDVETGEDQKGY